MHKKWGVFLEKIEEKALNEILERNDTLKPEDTRRILASVSQVKRKILNYIHQEELPEELYYVLVAMTEDVMGFRTDRFISRIHVGDTVTEFSQKNEDMEKLLFSYEKELNPFRKFKR